LQNEFTDLTRFPRFLTGYHPNDYVFGKFRRTGIRACLFRQTGMSGLLIDATLQFSCKMPMIRGRIISRLVHINNHRAK
jgi:hypothetical protein